MRLAVTLGHLSAQLEHLTAQEDALPEDAYRERADVRDEITETWRLVPLAADLPDDYTGRLLHRAAGMVVKRSADMAMVWRVLADSTA